MANSFIMDKLQSMMSMTRSIGIEAVSRLYPNDFEVYMVALELTDSQDNMIDYLVFPVLPDSITKTEPTRTNIKKSLAGVTVLTNPSYTPQEINIKGSFGRNFKILRGKQSGSAFSVNAGKYDLYSVKSKTMALNMNFGEFDLGIKTGYGVLKILKAMCDKSIALDENGKPMRLYFYNMPLGESYLVAIPPSGVQYSQDVSKNMIWNYNLTMMTVAPLEAVRSQSKGASSLVNDLLPSLVQMGVSSLASGVEKATRGIRSAIL